MPRRKFSTEEERLEAKREANRKWFYNKYHNDEEFRKKQVKRVWDCIKKRYSKPQDNE